ncbi:MAG: Uma2 family endonuclease [Isosphaeraceae bacterium]
MATITRRIGPADHGQPLSFSAFLSAEFEDGWLYELARGVIDVTEVPGISHGRIVNRVSFLFLQYEEHHPEIIHYQSSGSGCRIRVPGMNSDRHPDYAVYLTPPPTGKQPWTRWVPDLVIEIVSKGGERRDYIEKREEYLQIGVREYWILDPAKQELLVLRRAGDVWDEYVVPLDSVYQTPLLPGLEVRPLALFGAA